MLEVTWTTVVLGSAAVSVLSFTAGVVVTAVLAAGARADDVWQGRSVREWAAAEARAAGAGVDGAGRR
jgi:hypothetical protein